MCKSNQNLSLADDTYLNWYEMTHALSHAHIDAIFSRFQQQLLKEIRRNGTSELPTTIVIKCFREATQKIAQNNSLRRYECSIHCEDETA